MARSVGDAALLPCPSGPNSQSPLEIIMSFRGARLGFRGLMRSSTVTAAMALMLVDAVLRGGGDGGGAGEGSSHPPWGPPVAPATQLPSLSRLPRPHPPGGRGGVTRVPREWRRGPRLSCLLPRDTSRRAKLL